jgi:hypothetical protein
LSWISCLRSKAVHEERVSSEGVGVGGSERAVLGGKRLGVEVNCAGQGLGLLPGVGYNLKFQSKATKGEIKLQ